MALSLLGLRILLSFSHLPETGGVSVNVLYGINRIIHDQPLYTSPELAPFPIIQYMPFHFYLVKSMAFLTGTQELFGIMILNRCICLLFDLLCTWIIAVMLIRCFRMTALASWSLALIYFLSIPGIIYGRVDNVYLFFTIASFSLSIRNLLISEVSAGTRNEVRKWILPGILAGLSLLSKQTGLYLCVFTAVFILLRLKNSVAFLFFSGACVLVFTTGILLMQPGDADAIRQNIIEGVKNGINVNWFAEVILKNYFLKHSYLIALGILIGWMELRQRDSIAGWFIGAGIAWYFIVATLSSFKAGSGPNYYLEFLTLTLMGIGNLSLRYASEIRKLMPYALILTPFFLLTSANDKGWGDTKSMSAAKADYNNCEQVAEYLNPRLGSNEWVMTGFHKENLLNLMLVDKALFPCREVAFYFTWNLGVFHFREFEKLKLNKQIKYVVVKNEKLPGEYLNVNFNDFVPDTSIAGYQIYSAPE